VGIHDAGGPAQGPVGGLVFQADIQEGLAVGGEFLPAVCAAAVIGTVAGGHGAVPAFAAEETAGRPEVGVGSGGSCCLPGAGVDGAGVRVPVVVVVIALHHAEREAHGLDVVHAGDGVGP